MKIKFVLCFAALSFGALNAQNTLSGKITGLDDSPLPEVIISIPDLNRSTISDDNGYYELRKLPDGKIKVQFSYIGYATRIENIELVSKSLALNVSMTETALEMEEIIVTSGYISSQHENVLKIDILSLNPLTIKNSPNLTEVLTHIPGVDMISRGAGISKPVIRGLSMNDILVLSNGVRFENYQYSSHHPLGIDEFGIENVEVIKGPASLFYGSDALGGVVNFIKEKPDLSGSISGDYNLQLFSNSLSMTNNLGIKGSFKNFFGGIRAGFKTNADYLQGEGDFVPNSRFNEYSVKTFGGFTEKIGTFKLYFDFNNQRQGLVDDEALEIITKRGRKNDVFYQELRTSLVSSQNKLLLGEFRLELNSAYQITELAHFAEEGVPEIQMKLGTLTYEGKLHLPSKLNSEYIIGFQGFNQINRNLNDREIILLPDATTNNYSLMGLFQHPVQKDLNLQAGIRYDWKSISSSAVGQPENTMSYRQPLNKNYGNLSGSAGAVYNFTKNFILRVNISAAYRTPNLAELTSKGQHELRFEVGDNNLSPANSIEGDAGLHFHDKNYTLDIAGFYNAIKNYIFITPTGDTTNSGVSVYQYKQSNSVLYGGEAGLHFHPASAEWLHIETTISALIGKKNNGEYLPFIPAHKLKLELRAESGKLWSVQDKFISVNLSGAFDQNNTAPDETPTKGYVLLDLSIGGNIRLFNQNVSLIISAYNIFDKKYIDHLSTLKEVSFNNPGRNIAFTLKLPFSIFNK